MPASDLPYPVPPDEAERVAAVRALELLDTPPEERFDRILKATVRFFRVPLALITLIDEDRQWAKASFGPASPVVARQDSICAHTIAAEAPLIVEDLLRDDRFKTYPAVLHSPYLRFYAGIGLRGPGGHPVGTLCLLDDRPRKFGKSDRYLLESLAGWVEREMSDLELAQTRARLEEVERDLGATRKALETVLLRQSTLSPEFVLEMTREIRTSLNRVSGMADLLWETTLDTRQREYVQALRKGAAELLSRTSRLLGLQADKPQIPPLPGQARNDDRTIRILLAEDSADNRDLVHRFLKATSYQVEEAANGAIALSMFKKGTFDLVLMDLDMPIMDGFAAARSIRVWETQNGRRPTPVVALTANAVPEELQGSLEAGCDSYLTKPVKRGILLEAIRHWTAGGGTTL